MAPFHTHKQLGAILRRAYLRWDQMAEQDQEGIALIVKDTITEMTTKTFNIECSLCNDTYVVSSEDGIVLTCECQFQYGRIDAKHTKVSY